VGKSIPETAREILKQWQAQGLKFKWLGSPGEGGLGFDGDNVEDYEIVEQPIPEQLCGEGKIPKASREILKQWSSLGLKFKVSGMKACLPINFTDADGSKYSIPAQPIPARLPEELITELPMEKCIIGQETDPNGLNPHAPGAKLDAGKNRLGLVLGGFAQALEQVGIVGTFGAEKYSPNGWKSVTDGIARYEDAMLRHWVAFQKGEEVDPATGILHRAQFVWNALAALELTLASKEK